MPKIDKDKKHEKDLPFEEILGRLSQVVDSLENGELSLEESLKLFEEGVQLSKLGTKELDRAEQKIEWLLTSSEGSSLEDDLEKGR